MKKIFTLFLCLLYTIVSFGGVVFVHNCNENFELSIYEKTAHSSCPICAKKQENKDKSKTCESGSCKDIEIKINQLSDKLFSSNSIEKVDIHPLTIARLWVEPYHEVVNNAIDSRISYVNKSCCKKSPPIYIIYRNIRN